jgi:hypothetical protein
MTLPNVEDLIEKAMSHGWRIACEVPLSQFGEQADLRASEFTDYLAGLARDGLHIDYEGSWGIFLQMPVDPGRLDQLPGKITRGISHQLNPRILRLTFSRTSELASASRAA